MRRLEKKQIESQKKYFEKFKLSFFSLNHVFLNHIKGNSIIYKIFMIIELFQLVYFNFQEDLHKMWQLRIIDYIRTITRFFQLHRQIKGFDHTAYLAAVIAIIIFLSIMLGALCYLIMSGMKHVKSGVTVQDEGCVIILKIVLTTALILMNTIGTIPVAQISLNGFFCETGSSTSKQKNSIFF